MLNMCRPSLTKLAKPQEQVVRWPVLGEEKVEVVPGSGEVIQRHTGKNKIV